MRDPVKTVYAVTLFAMMLLAGCFGSGVVDTPEVEAQATGSEVTLAQFTTLEGAVTAAENAITTVQTSLTNHETRIAALETKLAAAEAALQGLNNQATSGTNAAPIVEIEGAASTVRLVTQTTKRHIRMKWILMEAAVQFLIPRFLPWPHSSTVTQITGTMHVLQMMI